MKLAPRTTYVNGYGDRVCIAGLAKREVEGKQCYWSIQGDHYTEDGRFVYTRRVGHGAEDFGIESFTLDSDMRSIVREDASEEAKRWWDGVSE